MQCAPQKNVRYQEKNKSNPPIKSGACQKKSNPPKKSGACQKKQVEPTKKSGVCQKKQIELSKKDGATQKTSRSRQTLLAYNKQVRIRQNNRGSML